MESPPESPAGAPPEGRDHLLSDRTVLKLAMLAIALVLGWAGVDLGVAGAGMTTQTAPAELGEEVCPEPASGEDGALGACVQNQVAPATYGVTAMGRALQGLALLLVGLAVALLVYQWWRWHPRLVHAWLPRIQATPVDAAAGNGGSAPR